MEHTDLIILQGKPAMEGIAIGKLHLLHATADTDRPNDLPDESVADPTAARPADSDVAKARFYALRQQVADDCTHLAQRAREEVGENEAEIFETHCLMVLDDDLEEGVLTALAEGQGLADAIRTAGEAIAVMLGAMEDEYLRARAADARDVTARLLSALQGKGEQDVRWDEPVLFAALDLTPAELLQAERGSLLGFFTAEGAVTSHTAILARSLSLPSVLSVGAFPAELTEGQTVIVDGFAGQVILSPDADTLALYRQKQAEIAEAKLTEERYRGKPAVTADGYRMEVLCNIGSAMEVSAVLANDGGGVGLFRSEFLYLEADDFPDEEMQYRVYRSLAEKLDGRPAVIRTMDVGADKQAAYFGIGREDNPALGYRSIRICMDRPEILLTQLRAIYRASAHGKLSILIPMITSAEELRWVRERAEEVQAELARAKVAFDRTVPIGIMIETPAAALLADRLAELADFFSVGTNDLTQYTLAVDRQNHRVERLYDHSHPAVLRLIAQVTEQAHRAGKRVSVCGEAARDSRLIPFFAAIGVDRLSVSPPYVLRVKGEIARCRRTETDIQKWV